MSRYLRIILTILLSIVGVLLVVGYLRSAGLRPVQAGSPEGVNAPTKVGMDIGGKNAYETVGRIDQNGGSFIGYGYLNHVSSLADNIAFSDPINHSETTAYFTYFVTSTLTSHSVITSVFIIDSVGYLRIFYNPTHTASFTNPASFAAGTLIAKSKVRGQDILNVQSPNKGVATGFTEDEQILATPFTINTQDYQFGEVGLLERGFYTGEGTRTDSVTPKSFVIGSGNTVVTGLPGQAIFMPVINH